MNEKTFNKVFNAFILIGMAVCVIISCIFKIQEPGARTALLIVSTFGALMGVVSVVLSANGSIWTFVFGLVDVLIYSYILYDSKMPSQLLLYVGYFIPMEFIGASSVLALHDGNDVWTASSAILLGILRNVSKNPFRWRFKKHRSIQKGKGFLEKLFIQYQVL